MKHLAPDFFQRFACAASACQDSCCRAGWEIVIDRPTLARYDTLPGADGARVRGAAIRGEEALLRQDGDRVCVLLDPDGLCHAQKCFGHESLCRVCREYPRFHREYGSLTEHGISLSCPTAFHLATERPFAWIQWEDEAPIVPNDLDPERYLPLRRGRDLALTLLAREDRSPAERLVLVWALAMGLQKRLDGSKRAGEAIFRRLGSPIGQRAVLRRFLPRASVRSRLGGPCPCFSALPSGGARRGAGRASQIGRPSRRVRPGGWADPWTVMENMAGIFSGLEILSPQWKSELEAFRARLRQGDPPSGLWEQSAQPEIYLRYLRCSLYKYWLDAADDGLLLPRVRRSLAMTELALAMDLLTPTAESWLRRISREIEHCEENLEALLEQPAPWGELS